MLQHITHHADRLEGEEDGAEEEREILNISDGRATLERQGLSEDEVKYDCKSGKHEDVGERRERCEEFQVSNVIDEDQRQQDDRHVHLQVQVEPLVQRLKGVREKECSL